MDHPVQFQTQRGRVRLPPRLLPHHLLRPPPQPRGHRDLLGASPERNLRRLQRKSFQQPSFWKLGLQERYLL